MTFYTLLLINRKNLLINIKKAKWISPFSFKCNYFNEVSISILSRIEKMGIIFDTQIKRNLP